MPGPATDDELNQQISDVLTELIKHAHDMGQGIATEFGLTGSDAIALLKLEAPMTMKELGQKMGCDPSYVTSIADALEKHGLARREPSVRDRRSKNIVLTPDGVIVRNKVLRELGARAPWCTSLDTRRAAMSARPDAQDAPAMRREVMLSQPRRLSRQR